MCVYVCEYVRLCLCMITHANISGCMYTVILYVYECMYVYVCMRACVRACVLARVCVCV